MQKENKKGVMKGMNVKKLGHRVMAFVLAFAMLVGNVSLPQASTQLESTIPFEYGSGALTNLNGATMVGQSSKFTFNGYPAYPILETSKTNRYLSFSDAGYYVGSDGKNKAVDMRVYLWSYQEDTAVSEEDKVYPFVWIDNNGQAQVYSSRADGTYSSGYGAEYHAHAGASNGGVHMEYHFYEHGTTNEIPFKGVIAYNDLDGITDAADATNEGIAFESGKHEVIKTTSTVIQEQERAGYLWYQGSMSTEDILGDDGLDQDDQKLTVKFESTASAPLRIAYRLNTVQKDGRIDGYGYAFSNEAVTISYQIPSNMLPALSSNQTAKALIEAGGGEQVRFLDYGTQTNSSNAQAVLNKPAKAVEGYTFDGWYESDQYTKASKWSGTDAITDRLVLYGRYVKNKYKVSMKCIEETTNAVLGDYPEYKEFEYGDRVFTGPPVFGSKSEEYIYQLTGMSVNGGAKTSANATENVHFDSNHRIAGNVNVVYYYKAVKVQGTVTVQHLEKGTNKKLAEDTVLTGELGETCHVAGMHLSGYKLTLTTVDGKECTSSTGITPKYTTPATVVIFYYEPEEDSEGITVHYQYKDGSPVTTDSDRAGKVGDTVNADTIRTEKEQDDLDSSFDGLEFLGVKLTDGTIVKPGDSRYSANTNVTLSKGRVHVTFVYRPVGADIVVKHISKDACDGGNKVLKTEDKVFQRIGDIFVAKSDTFEGYDLYGDSGNTIYKVEESDNGKTIVIEYYYIHETHKLTVHHKDNDGNTFVYRNLLSGEEEIYNDAVTSNIHYGTKWTAAHKYHYGYNVIKEKEVTGTMGKDDVEVTYIYTPKPATVRVHYVQSSNNAEIITPVDYTEWHYGDNFTVYADNDRLTDAQKDRLADWKLVEPQSGRIAGLVNKFEDDIIEVYFLYTKAAATVTVKHIWENELGVKEDITTPEIIEGSIGDSYTSQPWSGADDAGFALKQTPDNASGTMDTAERTIEYVYVKKQSVINVRYMTKDGKDNLVEFGLAGTTISALYDEYKEIKPKTYPDYAQAQGYTVTSVQQTGASGWAAVRNEDDEVTSFQGKVANDKITITFIYEPVGLTVTTVYKDLSNGDIKGPDAGKAKDWVQNYKAYETYTTHSDDNPPPEFYGYEWTKSYPKNAYGQLKSENEYVIYNYGLKWSGYIVQYLDEDGNRLANDKECTRENGNELYVFDEYDESPVSITGYDYKGLADGSAPASGTLEELDEDGHTVTVIKFVYHRSAAQVVVRYVDTENNRLSEPDTLNGSFGNAFNASPKTIDGYTLVSVEATGDVTVNDANTVSGHYSDITQTIKFIYTPTETKVVVNHIDEESKCSLADTEEILGVVGDSYIAKPVDLYGYTCVTCTKDEPVTGTMKDGVTIVNLMYRRNDATVTTYFVDNISGRQIKEGKDKKKVTNPVVVNGRYKDAYQTEPAKIYGWKLVKTPENASGYMIDGDIEVTYLYEEYIPKVTVKYVDMDDNHEVSETEIITGSTGTRYETVAKDFDKNPEKYPELYGYELVSMPDNASGVYGEEDITVTYGYKKKTRTVTVLYVEYVDGEMVEIEKAETLADLTVGEWYSTTAKTVPGYTLIDVPDNAKGYVTEKPVTVIYVYQKTAATVKVRFVNETMADIAESITISGNIGDSYTTAAKEIPGYQVMTIPSNWKGTMNTKETYVTYVYKVATATVTTRYVDADTGENLMTNIVRVYPYGSEYKTEEKSFHGYSLIETPSNASGVVNDISGIIVTYYYTAKDASVTAKYVTIGEDGNEKQISTPIVQTGTIGSEYKTEAKDIDGFVLDHVDGETTGKLVKGNTVIVYYYKALPAKVVVRYVDTNGASIANEDVIEGNVGDVYDTEQKLVEGYSLTTMPLNASGKMQEKTIYVVYIYKADDSVVITNYVDEAGKEIADSEYATYRRNATYQTVAKDIYGYTLTDTPANAYGNADKETITVTYVYRLKQSSVNVMYIDDETNESIADGETISGNVFDEYTTQAKEIDGYKLKEEPSNAKGTIAVEAITVIYKYVKETKEEDKDSRVTIKYVDEDGKEIEPSTEIKGKEGDEYKTEPKTIDGYELKETPENASGTMKKGEITVTYTYKKSENYAKVTVKYVDKNGKELLPETVINGVTGKEYKAEAKNITGYILAKTPDNASGKMTKEDIVVTFVYEAVKKYTVVAKYVDQNGKEIASKITIEGIEGDAYKTSAKTIDGYELIETPKNATGKIEKNNIEVVYKYIAKAKVIVKYVDDKGNEIIPSVTISGKEGDKYKAEAKEVNGFKLVKTPGNASGNMTSKDITVTFTYEKIEKNSVTVRYVDEAGNVISDSTVISGNTGDPYKAEPKVIKGYVLKDIPKNAEGKIGKDIVVTFVYKSTSRLVTVLYVDSEGKTIATATVISGQYGDPYETVAKEIDGYTVTGMPDNASGTIGDEDITVTYTYKKDDEEDGDLAVNKTASSQTITAGSSVDYTIKVSASGNDVSDVVVTDKFDSTKLVTSGTIHSYIIDTKTRTFHSPECSHLDKIDSKAKTTRSYAALTKLGYSPANDCSTAENSSALLNGKMNIDQKSLRITDSDGKNVEAVKTGFTDDGTMTITLDTVKKDETVTITYTANADKDIASGTKVTNVATVKTDDNDEESSSAVVEIKNNKNTPVNNNNGNKPNKSDKNDVHKNNNPQVTIKDQNTTGVRTGDAYTIIFVLLSGMVLAGGLGFMFLRKKK